MGVVVMSCDTLFRSRGYPYDQATLAIYCDLCGSFQIESYITPRRPLLILISCAIVGTSLYATFQSPGRFYWFILSLVLCLIVVKLFWGEKDYRCKKCRRATTIRYNTLDYTLDRNALDVPEQDIQKYYLEGWPDMGEVGDFIRLPPPQPARTRTEIVKDFFHRFGKGIGVLIMIPVVIIYFAFLPVLILVGLIYNIFNKDGN